MRTQPMKPLPTSDENLSSDNPYMPAVSLERQILATELAKILLDAFPRSFIKEPKTLLQATAGILASYPEATMREATNLARGIPVMEIIDPRTGRGYRIREPVLADFKIALEQIDTPRREREGRERREREQLAERRKYEEEQRQRSERIARARQSAPHAAPIGHSQG